MAEREILSQHREHVGTRGVWVQLRAQAVPNARQSADLQTGLNRGTLVRALQLASDQLRGSLFVLSCNSLHVYPSEK
jgi:hypothetical protein